MLSIIAVLFLFGCSSCSSTIGGGCAYDDVPGSITITEVVPGPEGEYNCPNSGMRVTFDFTPDDSSQASDRDSGERLTVGGGANPPQSCLEAAGLTVGATFTARRRDITNGTCSPVAWDLDVPNLDACQEQCHQE